MTGGGARAAYQVGVLKAIAEITPTDAPSPFQIICGTSAGAINATGLATHAHDFNTSVLRIVNIWSNFHVHHVFRSDLFSLLKIATLWLIAFMSFGFFARNEKLYLLDRSPLVQLLTEHFTTKEIQQSIDKGYLHALCISASGYSSHESVSFFQGHPSLKSWSRSRRNGARADITVDHLLGSSAIPFIFAPQLINREYFGDGSMRQTAPISPALHLGAKRILVIGNRHESEEAAVRCNTSTFPSFGEIAGHALNSIFLDSLDADIERLTRINKTISLIPAEKRAANDITLKKIEVLTISPSQDIGALANQYVSELPTTMRLLVRGVGAHKSADSSLLSYILFERGYCQALIQLGYKDAMNKKAELKKLLFAEDVLSPNSPISPTGE